MNFTKRKVYIEFLSAHRCRVTTPFRQKEFHIAEDCVLDLLTFKKVEETYLMGEVPFSFFLAFFVHDTNKYNYAEACLVVQTSEFDVEAAGAASIVDNNKVFVASVWDGD